MRAKREQELGDLKKNLADEIANHEASISSMKTKHAHAMQELSDELDVLRKVGFNSGRPTVKFQYRISFFKLGTVRTEPGIISLPDSLKETWKELVLPWKVKEMI